jgi:hypothetical protein
VKSQNWKKVSYVDYRYKHVQDLESSGVGELEVQPTRSILFPPHFFPGGRSQCLKLLRLHLTELNRHHSSRKLVRHKNGNSTRFWALQKVFTSQIHRCSCLGELMDDQRFSRKDFRWCHASQFFMQGQPERSSAAINPSCLPFISSRVTAAIRCRYADQRSPCGLTLILRNSWLEELFRLLQLLVQGVCLPLNSRVSTILSAPVPLDLNVAHTQLEKISSFILTPTDRPAETIFSAHSATRTTTPATVAMESWDVRN